MLIAFGGLPGVGKTTLARELARRLECLYLRIDSIEQAIRNCGAADPRLDVAGYEVGYAIAGDNLALGQTIVADSVNPLAVTRDAWAAVASRAHTSLLEVEVVCSDRSEHRRRVETRSSDIPGRRPPDWPEVASREYHPWNRERILIDTARQEVDLCVETLLGAIHKRKE